MKKYAARAFKYGSYISRALASLALVAGVSTNEKPASVSTARRRTRSAGGRRSCAVRCGGALKTCERSATVWRHMANVSRAWRVQEASSTPATIKAHVSKMAASEASQDSLACWERK